jgi:hypothetical protein
MDLHIGTAITGTVTADLGFGPLLFRQWRLKRLSNSAPALLSDVYRRCSTRPKVLTQKT